MKKFNAVNKRNQKGFILSYLEDGKIMALDVVTGKEKEITEATIKRWYEIGKEILPEVKKIYTYEYLYRGFSFGCQPRGFIDHDDSYGRFGSVSYDRKLTEKDLEEFELVEVKKGSHRQHSRSVVKKDGSVRNDKFRPKLDADQAYEILNAYRLQFGTYCFIPWNLVF